MLTCLHSKTLSYSKEVVEVIYMLCILSPCEYFGISLSADGDIFRSKADYIGISPNPIKTESTLGRRGVVVVDTLSTCYIE